MSVEAGPSTSQPATHASNPQRAVSILSKGCTVELKPCTSKPCCCNNVHCPMCPVEMFPPAAFQETSTHLVNEHISKAVEVQACLCLLCKLPCDSAPHFHCPTCSFTSRRTHLLRRHSEKCQSMRGCDNMWSILASLKVKGVQELLDELGLQPNQDVPKPIKVFKHPSIVLRLTDLPVPRCQTCCDQFHCPICPTVCIKSGPPQRIAQHLITSHWKRRLSINNIQILKCTMNSCLRNPNRHGQSHYHCPLCPKVTLSINRASKHFLCHKKGTVKKDRVESCNAPSSSSQPDESDELAELLNSPDDSVEGLEGATVHGYIELPAHFGEKEIELTEEVEEEDSKQNADLSTVNIQLIATDDTKQEAGDVSPEDQENSSTHVTHLVAQRNIQPVLISVPGTGSTYVLDNTTEEGAIVDEAHGQTIQELFLPQSTVTSEGCIMAQEAQEGYIVDQTLPGQVYVVNPMSGELTGSTVPPDIQFHVGSENATDVEPPREVKVENQDQEEEEDTANDETATDHEERSTHGSTLNDESQSVMSTQGESKEDHLEVPSNSAEAPDTETSQSSSPEVSKLSEGKQNNDVFESVSAVLNKQLFQSLPDAKGLMMEALHKNFGLTCKAVAGGGVEMEGAWWQMACAHMILEDIRDTRPTTAKQLARILDTNPQASDEQTDDSKEVSTSPETCKTPENKAIKHNAPPKRKRGRPKKNSDDVLYSAPTTSRPVAREARYKRAVVERPATRSKRRKINKEAVDDSKDEETDIDSAGAKHVSDDIPGDSEESSPIKTQRQQNKERLESLKRSIVVIQPVDDTANNELVSGSDRLDNLKKAFGIVQSHMNPADEVTKMLDTQKSKTVQIRSNCEPLTIENESLPADTMNKTNTDLLDDEDEDETRGTEDGNIVTPSVPEKEVTAVDTKHSSITDSWDIDIKYNEDSNQVNAVEDRTEDENSGMGVDTDESNHEEVANNEMVDMPVVEEFCIASDSSQDQGVAIQGRVTEDIDCPEARDPVYRTCPNCATTFSSRPELFYHILETERESCRKYRLKSFPHKTRPELTTMRRMQSTTCGYCNMTFETLNDAKVHSGIRACRPKRAHNPLNLQKDSVTGLFKCSECNYMGKLPAVVVAHMELKHRDKTLPCPMCKRMFSTQKHLQRHVEFIHVNQRRVTCTICGKELMEKYMRKHVKDVHITRESSHKLRKLPEPVFCGEELCTYSTHYLDVLKKHKKRMHGVKDKNCEICGASFAFIGDLNAHKKIHKEIPGRLEVSCPKCDKVMMKQNLATHMKTVHEQKRLFTCNICSKSFTTKYVLNCHVETHKKPGDRSYKFICDYCGAGFINKTIYADHLNTHTGQRPYKCPTCGKSFRQTSVFHKHLELHSNVKYFCAPCNEMFPNKRAYSNHKAAVHMLPSLKILKDSGGEETDESGVLSMEQAAAILSSHHNIQTSQILIHQDGQNIVLSDEQVSEVTESQPDPIPAPQSLVTLEDGTVVLVEGDLSQSTAEEGIVPHIVGPEGVLVTQGEELEGQVVQFQQEGEAEMLETVAVPQEGTGYQCGHCHQYFKEIEDIRQHIEDFHSEHLEESSSGMGGQLHDHATGTTHTLILQQELE